MDPLFASSAYEFWAGAFPARQRNGENASSRDLATNRFELPGLAEDRGA